MPGGRGPRTRRQGSARGLAALIPTSPDEIDITDTETRRPIIGRLRPNAVHTDQPCLTSRVSGLELVAVPVHAVSPNRRQPRQEFDPEALEELARSFVQVGVLQPIVVRRMGPEDAGADSEYELVAGERRLRAASIAGMETIPALVRSTADDDLLREALLENLQRVQLNPLEEAAAYEQLLADFGGTHDELANKLGRSRSQISNTVRLLRLPPGIQRRVAAGVLSAGHARALLGMDDVADMEILAKRAVAEGMSVRTVEELVALGGTRGSRPRGSGRPTGGLGPEFDALARRLGERFDTRVRVHGGRNRGRIVIDFSGVEDLHRVARLLGDQPEE